MRILFLFVCLAALTQCAKSEQANLEKARFALDREDYTEAIELATDALNDNSQNVDAARVLASAYFGRSGLDFLDIAEAMLDLETSDQSNFATIAGSLPDNADLDDVRSAIEILETLDDLNAADVDGDEADASYDLGLMQAIEHFALGVYGSDYYGTFAVTGITDAQRQTAQADLIDFDDRLIASGVDEDSEFIQEIRQTFCILEPISAGEGFTQAEFQALVGCELSADSATFDTVSLTADIANCAALDPDNQSADVTACFSEDTAL